jgi:4-hydroxyphenylpyruvate dioxygenase
MSLGGGLKEKLYAIAAAGFRLVDISEGDLLTSDMSPSDIAQLLDEVGLSVSMFRALSDLDAVSERTLDKSLQRARNKFELMCELKAPLLLVPASAVKGTANQDGIVARQLRELARSGSLHGIKIGYEARAAAGTTFGDAWRIVNEANHPAIGLVLNSLEVLAGSDGAFALAQLPGDRVFMVQLADAPAPLDVTMRGRHFQCLPGQGTLDVVAFAAQVVATGYTGAFSLHVLNDEVRAAPVRQSALDAMRSLTFVEEQLYRLDLKTSDSLFSDTAPPPPPAPESIRFIEFAVDSDSRQVLGQWLEALGFSSAGQHRSKEAHLYRQGEVLVVLNAGTDTFAHYYHHLHGTSVCAFGLHIPDTHSLLDRADLYLYQRYDERRGLQEYEMPAVRAPDGSLIHLLGDDYDPTRDFTVAEPNSEEPHNIQRIDHIGRAVPPGQANAWILFYRVLLGLEPGKSLSIPDPHGSISSTELHDRRHRLRLPLTFSEYSGTVISESLSNFGGAGINQIAFETDDIYSSVAAILKKGLRLLTIPSNYYRDLVLDRGIPESLAAKLEDHNLLYDMDENGGEFFHAYTEFFERRFFFEIVQRTKGYDRYGEINSPVRLAVQAKQHLRRTQQKYRSAEL